MTSRTHSPARPSWVIITLLMTALAVTAGWSAVYLQAELKAMKAELAVLKTGQESLQKELAGLVPAQTSRRARPGFEPVELTTGGAPSLGDGDAPVTLVEFTDYQCPYCRRHALDTLPRLIAEYVETGKLRYLIREMPVEANHPLSGTAAEAALCAGDQGAYWMMHDRLFADQERLQPEDLKKHARTLGLDSGQFEHCLDSGEKKQRIEADVKAGRKAGMRGTPTFFLGVSGPRDDDRFLATRVIRGAKPYRDFAIIIDHLLIAAAKETAPETTAGVDE